MRSAHVFPRHTKADLPVAVKGDGVYIIDSEGKQYLDACGGAAVSCLGHSAQSVIEAMKAQLDTIAYAHTSFFTSEPAENLAEILANKAPGNLNRVYFVSGGSEAMEAALKLARQYFLEKGQPQRRHMIARWQSYHGNTLGALSAGGNRWRRAQFEPLLVGAMHHVSPCHAWRWKEAHESDDDYTTRLANELEQTIQKLGPDTVAAFMAEPVVGATMGAVPPVEGYFRKMRDVCDRYGVLMILDEVMCGMGRTGSLFACKQDNIVPDMIAIAKGLGAGYQPIGALLVSDDIYNAVEKGSGFFQHGHTYIGHPTACAAGIAVLKTIEEQNLLENVRIKGQALKAGLKKHFANHPHIGDIRGRGLFIGLELVEDQNMKEPFPTSCGLAAKIKKAAMQEGLMCYPMSGTVDGEKGDHILLAPPFIIEDKHIDFIIEKLGKAVEKGLENAKHEAQ